MRYGEIRRALEHRFEQVGIEDHLTDARYILQQICGLSSAELLLKSDEEVPTELMDRIEAAAVRREGHEPLQYILGSQEFMGLDFVCSPACLIPRQDTELLVYKALERIKERADGNKRLRVLDMCTGTGCIATSVAVLSRDTEVTGADISAEALTVARSNAEHNGASVRFVESDMFSSITDTYDMILCNPPYISSEIIPGLMPEVREHEPVIALDGGADGLMFYRWLVEQAPKHLTPGGVILMEIGDEQGKAVSGMFTEHGFEHVRVYKDLAGLDRVVEADLP